MTDVVKEPVRNVWAIVDYGPIAVGDVFVSELLARSADIHAGHRVLDDGGRQPAVKPAHAACCW